MLPPGDLDVDVDEYVPPDQAAIARAAMNLEAKVLGKLCRTQWAALGSTRSLTSELVLGFMRLCAQAKRLAQLLCLQVR